jgi:hypothetical protein
MARVAKAMKKDLVKAKKACIGKKMKGFKFVDKIHDSYNPRMDLCINHVGEITDYIVGTDKFRVDFENTTTWFYPATRALKYIVEEPEVVKEKAELKKTAVKKTKSAKKQKVYKTVIKPNSEKFDVKKLVGRKMTAFKFKSGTNGILYEAEMNNLLSHDGTIIEVRKDNGAVLLSFKRMDGDIELWYPFGKDVETGIFGKGSEKLLISEKEVQRILASMPKEPFIFGQTVYIKANGGQYKCKIIRADFKGTYPITLDPGKSWGVFTTTVDGRTSPDKDATLSHIIWCNELGIPLEIRNSEQEIVDDTYTAMLKEEIADLSARLDGAYKEQEEMLEELRSWLKPFSSAFTKLQEHAGVITPEDVTYHTNLILKIMEHKFGYKPKMVEL